MGIEKEVVIQKGGFKGALNDTETELLKRKHGEIWLVTAGDSALYFKKPDRTTLGYASQYIKNPIKFGEIMTNNCLVGGDKTALEEDAKFLGIMNVLQELIEVQEVEIKKL